MGIRPPGGSRVAHRVIQSLYIYVVKDDTLRKDQSCANRVKGSLGRLADTRDRPFWSGDQAGPSPASLVEALDKQGIR
jgi:hypothetical protein